MRFLVPALLAATALCGCSAISGHASQVQTAPRGSNVAAATPGGASASSPRPASASSPRPALSAGLPSVAPSATPTGAPPDAPPLIYKVNIDKTTVNGGDTLSGSVLTSSNVASVEARVATYSITVPKTGVGQFALSYVVPKLPFFLARTYDMSIIARNTRGDATSTTIPITIH
ncbi:MAG: hypothetical protein M3R51_01240 [Candidatus Eremiobacteraeota bacterium]|nr:hypothetical protein [Candidatus Eremiobacteraeota bacterium]